MVGSNGVAVSTPKPLRIGSKSQLSILGSELFPGAAVGGWVYAINDTEAMQVFWLNYDAGTTFLNGGEAAQYDTIGADQIIPLAAGSIELNIINPSGFKTPITIRLFGSDGP